MRRFFSFFIGTLIGGIIGAGAALLFAPSAGKDLRLMISDRAQGFADGIRQAANTKRIELQERLDTLRLPRSQ
jgi:gas vesicle protein